MEPETLPATKPNIPDSQFTFSGQMSQDQSQLPHSEKPTITKKFSNDFQLHSTSVCKLPYANTYNTILEQKLDEQKKSTIKATEEPGNAQQKVQPLKYSDPLKYWMGKYEEGKSRGAPRPEPDQRRTNYSLMEDLKLLWELSKEDQITISSFKRLAQQCILNRSSESLRSRFHDFLSMITKQDLDKIYAYLEKSGFEGYLVFEKADNNRKRLKTILAEDPKKNLETLNAKITKKINKTIKPAAAQGKKQGKQAEKKLTHQARQLNEVEENEREEVKKQPPAQVQTERTFLRVPDEEEESKSEDGNNSKARINRQPGKRVAEIEEEQEKPARLLLLPPKVEQKNISAQASRLAAQLQQEEEGQLIQQLKRTRLNRFQLMQQEQKAQKQLQQQQQGYQQQQFQQPTQQFKQQQVPPQFQHQQVPPQFQQQQVPPQFQQQQQLQPLGLSQQQPQPYAQQFERKTMYLQPPSESVQQHFGYRSSGAQAPSQQPKHRNRSQAQSYALADILNIQQNLSTDKYENIYELDRLLGVLSDWFKVSKKYLIEIFDQLSADLASLDKYLKNKDETMIWTDDEDQILYEVKLPTAPELRLLIKIKSRESVKKRIKYLNINLPFEFD